jgi:Flp pilus assembly CpaE family ATPase
VSHPDILAFLPSKAGSGCSTVVLNTAAVLANDLGKRTLLIEGDRRSGVLSILLDVGEDGGLPAILAESGKLTSVGWRQHVTSLGKLDMLLANPLKPGPQPTWATYFQILDFVKAHYDYILVDLPELLNPATDELAQAARLMFIVCEPELASLKLVEVRRGELEAAGVAPDKIAVLGNRWEGRRLTKDGLEKTHVPMYAALPNDYLAVKNAAIESRLVSKDSAFARACEELARRVCGMQAPPEGRVGSLLRRFGKG